MKEQTGQTNTVMPLAEWRAECERRGRMDCGFVCPSCGNVATPAEFVRAGAEAERAMGECIGRLGEKYGGCDWAAFGLLDICSVHVDTGAEKPVPVFAFAEVAR